MSEAGPISDDRTRVRRENALLALFKIPVFRRVWAAIAFSSLGDWLGLLANTALAQQLTTTHSKAAQGAAISGVILVRLAPDLLFGAFAAALADKFDRRKLVIIGDTAAGLLYASIAISYHLLWLYVAQFVIEAVGLFTQPAKQVIWVAIVPKKLLATANQISLLSVYGSVPVAAALFALLSAGNRLIGGPTHGTNWAIVIALLINTVSFFISAGTIFASRRDISVLPSERERGEAITKLLREGVSFIRRDPLIRSLYVGIIGAFAAGGLTVGVAQLWVTTLDAGNAGYAIMFGTLFTGLAVGMLIGPRVLPAFPRSRVVGLAIGGAGVTLLVMSLQRDFILADALAGVVGMFAGIAWIVGYTLIGAEVEDRLRGRIFAFVLSSVRLTLLLTIAVGPVLAGALGSHSFSVGDQSRFSFSGPGLTLLIGGVLALGVSFYSSSRAGKSSARLRDLVRHRVVNSGLAPRHPAYAGIFISVDGTDADATAGYAALIVAELRVWNLLVTDTAEPTDSPTGRRVEELLLGAVGDGDAAGGLEPETVALLSAADRSEHVTSLIRPALQRGEVVVCDRYTLTSLALHGGGRGADVDRIRAVNVWSTGGLQPDLTVVVDDDPSESPGSPGRDRGGWLTGATDDLDDAAARLTLLTEARNDPERFVVCRAAASDALPPTVTERLARLVEMRGALIAQDAQVDSSAQVDTVAQADGGAQGDDAVGAGAPSGQEQPTR